MNPIELFREDAEKLKESERRRGNNPENVDRVVELDKEWREKLQELEKLQEKRNKVTDDIAELKQQGEDTEEEIQEMQELKQRIHDLEDEVDDLKQERDKIRYRVGNLLLDTVPKGEDEEDNVEIKRWNPPREKDEEGELAADILQRHDMLRSDKATEIGGERAYYLKGDLLHLNQALINFGINFIENKGFEVYQTPFMLEEDAISAAVDIEAFEDQLYQVNENGRYLIATAEHALAAMNKDEVLETGELPLKIGGFSTNFRREAGKHGQQTRGIWRVHQFEKVEQFMVVKPENNEKWLKWLLQNAEEVMQELGLPYRVVEICDGDIGDKTAKQYDIEVWRPKLQEYGELYSIGTCTNYQTEKLKTKYFEDGGRKQPYTLYATAVATERTMSAIIENYQDEEGVKIPEVLKDLMGGREYLRFTRNSS